MILFSLLCPILQHLWSVSKYKWVCAGTFFSWNSFCLWFISFAQSWLESYYQTQKRKFFFHFTWTCWRCEESLQFFLRRNKFSFGCSFFPTFPLAHYTVQPNFGYRNREIFVYLHTFCQLTKWHFMKEIYCTWNACECEYTVWATSRSEKATPTLRSTK